MDKPRFSVNDLLGFISNPANKAVKAVGKGAEKTASFLYDQIIGPEAEKYWNEAKHPSVDFNSVGRQQGYAQMGNISGITNNPEAMKVLNVLNNLTNAATHSGLGKWFAADSIQNLVGGNPKGKSGNVGDFANVVFSLAPFGIGKLGKPKGNAAISKEFISMMNLLRGMVSPTD